MPLSAYPFKKAHYVKFVIKSKINIINNIKINVSKLINSGKIQEKNHV